MKLSYWYRFPEEKLMRAEFGLRAVFWHYCIRLTQMQGKVAICRNKFCVMSVIRRRIIIIVESLDPLHLNRWTMTASVRICVAHTHSCSWALLEKSPIVQLLNKFPAFYGTQRFITVFTRALQWSLSWARSIQCIPSHPISLRSVLILSTHLRLGLSSGLFASGFPTKMLYSFLFSPFVLHVLPIHPPWLDHSNYTWWRVQVMKLLIM
jgi:hypothetical protein